MAIALAGGVILRRSGPVDERLARIRASGLPADWPEAETWYGGVPLEPDATDSLIRALEDLQSIDSGRGVPDRGTEWTAEDREWAHAQLARNTEASASLHAALAAGAHRLPLGTMLGPNANMGLQHLITIKRASQYLAVEAAARAEAGDDAAATASLIAGVRIGRTLDGGPVLIHHLMQIALHSIQVTAAERVLTLTSLPEESLVRLQAAWSGVLSTNTLQRVLVGERAYGVSSSRLPISDLYQSMDMSALTGVEVPIWERWAKMALLHGYSATGMRRRDLLTYLDHMEALIAAAGHGCTPEGVAEVAACTVAANQLSGSWTRPLSRQSLGNICSIPSKFFKLTTTLRCALTAAAVERFRIRHDRLPATPSDLVPGFLPSVPADPMTGEPLRYRRLDPGFVVYGVGEDGVDDGGLEYAARPKGRDGGWDVTFTVGR